MVDSFHGKTYVAYLDISGFAQMMEDLDAARDVLNNFYATIFDFCEYSVSTSPRISMIVASDCAVLFTRNQTRRDRFDGLLAMFNFVKHVNRQFIGGNRSQPFMTTCSVAYGTFDYEDRPEFADLRKNYVFGRPYLGVVLDQRKGKPKIRPGECRLLPKSVPRVGRFQKDPLFSFVLKRSNRRYFYWMLNNRDHQKIFDRDYAEAYKLRKQDNYSGVIHVLQSYVIHGVPARHVQAI